MGQPPRGGAWADARDRAIGVTRIGPARRLHQVTTSMAARFPSPLTHFSLRRLIPLGALLLGCAGAIAPTAAAQGGPPPAELKTLIERVDQAASDRDLAAVLAAYGPDFRTTDGLTRASLGDALTGLWEGFETVAYRTEITDWRRSRGDETLVDTLTTLTATGQQLGRSATLTATVRSRQTIRGGLIVAQEILAERSHLAVGERPPEVEAIAPEQVRPGDDFEFNAFVREPLGNQVLAGAAIAQATRPQFYGLPRDLQPVVLPGGGLFKRGQAGAAGDDQWLSAVLVSGDGMTVISQRLQVRR